MPAEYRPAFPKPTRGPKPAPKPMRRSSRIRPVSPTRSLGRWESLDYRQWIGRQPCAVHGGRCRAEAREACHIRSKGAGGSDFANVVPMCRPPHEFQHRQGWKAFAARFGVSKADLLEQAAALQEEYLMQCGPPLKAWLAGELERAEAEAWRHLARQEFHPFACWAGRWCDLAERWRSLGERIESPWAALARLALERTGGA